MSLSQIFYLFIWFMFSLAHVPLLFFFFVYWSYFEREERNCRNFGLRLDGFVRDLSKVAKWDWIAEANLPFLFFYVFSWLLFSLCKWIDWIETLNKKKRAKQWSGSEPNECETMRPEAHALAQHQLVCLRPNTILFEWNVPQPKLNPSCRCWGPRL